MNVLKHNLRGLAIILAALMATLLLAKAQAADPQLARTTPWGAQRGTEVDVALSGARLKDAQELLALRSWHPHAEVGASARRQR